MKVDSGELKVCAVCGAPYVGNSCPNCGSREVEEDGDD